MKPPISKRELDLAGWVRADPRPWRTKLDSRYQHRDGWTLEHCGHQTAIHPWLLFDPKGRLVLTGAAGPMCRPDFGTAWWTLRQVVEWVTTLDSHERENGLRWFTSPAGLEARKAEVQRGIRRVFRARVRP